MTELALDDIQRHAFSGELEHVGVPELMGRKPPSHPGLGGEAVELQPHSGA